MALWLAVLASQRGGFLNRVVKKAGSLDAALDMDPDHVRAIVGPPRRGRMGPDEQEESAFRAALASAPDAMRVDSGDGLVTWDDPDYPPALRQVLDAPPAVFLRGRVAQGIRDLGELPVVAIVGARNPSPYGREMTRLLARDLTDAGLLVISGMAMGIDACAQQEAVTARVARARDDMPDHVSTVAVLGCGIRVDYPRENLRLAGRIAHTGLMVSEFPGDLPARPWRFPCRNRIIAGLSRAVIVVEGGERSGSLLTADFGLQLGRDVLAVPGEAGRRLSAGPHKLLRQGAHLCESADDVLDAIGLKEVAWSTRRAPSPDVEGLFGALVAELDAGERTADELIAVLQRRAAEVAAMLAALEVDGLVVRVDGGRYRLRRD